MKSSKKIIILSLVGLMGLLGCDRQKLRDHVGPAICPSDKFVFTTPLSTDLASVNFAGGQQVVISSVFNEEVSWNLYIRGNSSNGLKTYSGRSRELHITWRGNADMGYPFFQTENCTIELVLACRDGVQTSLTMQPNTFDNFGYLLQNFDGIGRPAVFGTPGGANLNLPASGIKNTPLPLSPQGGNYYSLVGNAAAPTWYFGGLYSGVNFPANIDAMDPSEVYFNAFINGNGTKNSLLTVTFSQAGVSRNYNINPDWNGWRMVSFKLSDAGITNLAQVNGMEYSLGTALTQGTSAEVHIDFIIITPNAPFYDL